MLKNYLTIAIRILFRYKGYSLINISGLAIGMACAALILLYVQDELNFDTHHIKRDRIYRVLRELKSGDNSIFSYRTSGALAPAILQDIPAAEQAIRTFWFKTFVRYEDTLFDLQYCIADPEILNVFTIPFLKGDPKTALQGAGTAVLTASAAARIFGRVDPIGKQLRIDGTEMAPSTQSRALSQIPPRIVHCILNCSRRTSRASYLIFSGIGQNGALCHSIALLKPMFCYVKRQTQ